MIEYEKMMYSILNKYHIKNTDDYIDICYIGYVKALKTFNEEKSSFCTHVYRCMNHELIREIKKQNRLKRKHVELSLDYQYKNNNQEFFESFSSNVDLERDIIEQEKKKELYDAISKLNKNERTIIIKYYNLDNSDCKKGDIRNEVGLSRQRVDIIRNDALIKLKRMMKNE